MVQAGQAGSTGVASRSLEGECVQVRRARAGGTLTSVDKGRVRLAKEAEPLP